MASRDCGNGPGGTGVVPPPDGQTLIETLHRPPAASGLPQPRWRLADLRAVCPAFAGYNAWCELWDRA